MVNSHKDEQKQEAIDNNGASYYLVWRLFSKAV